MWTFSADSKIFWVCHDKILRLTLYIFCCNKVKLSVIAVNTRDISGVLPNVSMTRPCIANISSFHLSETDLLLIVFIFGKIGYYLGIVTTLTSLTSYSVFI